MSNDLTIHSGGGSLSFPSPDPGQSMSMPGPSAIARAKLSSTDGLAVAAVDNPAHFQVLGAEFGDALGQQVGAKALAAAKSLEAAVGRSGDQSFELPAIVDAFVDRLMADDVTDPHDVGKAVAVGVTYLAALMAGNVAGDFSARDDADVAQCRAKLRERWGANYRTTFKAIKNYVSAELPFPIRAALENDRDYDGRALGNCVDVILWLEQLALGGRGGGGGGSTDELRRELRETQLLMKANPKAYYGDERRQARYRELVEILANAT